MKITVEVVDPRGLSRRELSEAVKGGHAATLEMPFWGSAPQVKIVGYEGDGEPDGE